MTMTTLFHSKGFCENNTSLPDSSKTSTKLQLHSDKQASLQMCSVCLKLKTNVSFDCTKCSNRGEVNMKDKFFQICTPLSRLQYTTKFVSQGN